MMDRRFFLRLSLMAAASSLAGWRFAGAAPEPDESGAADVIVVGAGLGGLCCAAHLAQNGFKTLLLEQYCLPGGYATSFDREADGRHFTCEVSLHASALRVPDMRTMLTGLGVWDKIELVDHAQAWSSRFPGFSLDVPAKVGLDGFKRQLAGLFPAETRGLDAYFALWQGVMAETARLAADLPGLEQSQFPAQFPSLWTIHNTTVGQLVRAHVRNPRLRAVLTQTCGYYGLPPSRLSAFYYLAPTGEYLTHGGQYVKGTSQALSNALAKAVTEAGGQILYGARVASILMQDGRAAGVQTADGREFRARAVVGNASAPQVFGKFLPRGTVAASEQAKLDTYSPSPGSCIVWLGLKEDVTRRLPNAETTYYPTLDMEANYQAGLNCDFARSTFSLMVYDDLVPGFSPPGGSTLSVVALCGYGHWKPFETDYLAGRKTAYLAEKKRLTDILIHLVERQALPGLSRMIALRDSSTPLTNLRFTGNTAGAIYGYNQTVDNSFLTRIPNTTAVPGLYLASAWGNPGGGFTGALSGGKGAFQAVAQDLAKARA